MSMAADTTRTYREEFNSALTVDATNGPPKCGCGHDRDSPMARAEPSYGFTGWMCLIMGASARPERIAFRCRRCHAIIEETTAEDAIAKAY